jgi:phosphate:Na+ symporter
MVIGLVNAGVMTLMQATPIIMGANIGTTITGVLVALKNDYFNMLMYFSAFAGVMMGFVKNEKVKLGGLLASGLGLIFVGLEIMSSEQAFGSSYVKEMFLNIFSVIDFPLLLILVGVIFTALIQSSSAATGVVITMVGTGVMQLDLALFIILGANIGTCITAILASMGANADSKRVATIHLTLSVIGVVLFGTGMWIWKKPMVNLLTAISPGDDTMAIQMRASIFHVIFNVTLVALTLPFVDQLVALSHRLVKDKEEAQETRSLKYVDTRLLTTPAVALAQSKKEIEYMMELVGDNLRLSQEALITGVGNGEKIRENEATIDFVNSHLTEFLIRLSAAMDGKDEKIIGAYFHVLNDLERVGDHAENFLEIGEEMHKKGIKFSEKARTDIKVMYEKMLDMLTLSAAAFGSLNKELLPALAEYEDQMDDMKKELSTQHFTRLAEGLCSLEVSPYYFSAIAGLERVADHIVNVGFSIQSPVGNQKEEE